MMIPEIKYKWCVPNDHNFIGVDIALEFNDRENAIICTKCGQIRILIPTSTQIKKEQNDTTSGSGQVS